MIYRLDTRDSNVNISNILGESITNSVETKNKFEKVEKNVDELEISSEKTKLVKNHLRQRTTNSSDSDHTLKTSNSSSNKPNRKKVKQSLSVKSNTSSTNQQQSEDNNPDIYEETNIPPSLKKSTTVSYLNGDSKKNKRGFFNVVAQLLNKSKSKNKTKSELSPSPYSMEQIMHSTKVSEPDQMMSEIEIINLPTIINPLNEDELENKSSEIKNEPGNSLKTEIKIEQKKENKISSRPRSNSEFSQKPKLQSKKSTKKSKIKNLQPTIKEE